MSATRICVAYEREAAASRVCVAYVDGVFYHLPKVVEGRWRTGGDLRPISSPPEAVPVAWIQGDHLEKAKQAPFLCRVEPAFREGMGFVPIYTRPAAPQPSRAEVLKEAGFDKIVKAMRDCGAITQDDADKFYSDL